MKLTAYTLGLGYPLKLRPAPAMRDWMDKTPQSFAYRCLPLNIANSHGWEVLNPVGFYAVWDGGETKDSMRIQYDTPGGEMGAVSHFGSGVLTFHVNALFRTEPDYNLFVMGSPNSLKDGIQPLCGVVETDWSPYSFTMNWRFTRPNQVIRFEKDEPCCFFFPVPRGLLDRTEPEMLPLSTAPELKEQYEYWSAERNKFLKDVQVEGSEAHAQKWQKRYYLGNYPKGDGEFPAHQIKLRLKDFQEKS